MFCDLDTKCRTCLIEYSSYQIYELVEENYKILEMLDSLVPQINIKSTLQFSSHVCQNCVEKLLTGYKFQQMCIESNNKLQNVLGTEAMETQQTLDNNFDPLTAETDVMMKVEIGESVILKCEIHPEKLEKEVMLGNHLFAKTPSEIEPSSSVGLAQAFTDEFNSENNSKEIARTDHTDLKAFRRFHCRLCSKSFEKKESLAAHCKVHWRKDTVKTKSKIFQSGVLQENTHAIIGKEPSAVNVKSSEYKEPAEKDSNEVGATDLAEVEKPNGCTDIINFTCKVCGKTFGRSANLQRHSSVHSPNRPYECDICKYRFADSKILKAHLLQHKKKEINEKNAESLPEESKCEICHRSFMSTIQLNKHFKKQHPEAYMKHKCEVCNRIFILQDSLLKHIHFCHKSDQNLECLTCRKVFESSSKLRVHMRIHTSFLCPHCGKTFCGFGNLNEHMKRHLGLQTVQCPDCPKRFNCRSDLSHHAKSHSNAKPFACDICGSRFTRNSSMQHHKALHTAERTYKCDQCSMSFKLLFLLKRHKGTHTGEKPHKCNYCERAYLASGDLTKHLRIHVGQNTYMCDQCPMSFKYQAELRKHQSQHYKMEQNAQKSSEEIHHENVKEKQQEQQTSDQH